MSLNGNNTIFLNSAPSAGGSEGTSYGTTPPTDTAGYTAGHTWYVTPTGTSASLPTQQFRFDGAGWTPSPMTGEEGTTYSTAEPVATAGFVRGHTWYVTPLGTEADSDNATQQFRFDGTKWVEEVSKTAPWVAVTGNPPASGNTGILPRYTDNTNTGDRYYIDVLGEARLIKEGSPSGQNVYFDTTNPNFATIFDTENPPVTDIPALREDSANTFISAVDNSFWSWNGSSYATKVFSFPQHRRDVFVASSGQTVFTASGLPIGAVIVTRNGPEISDAFTWSGKIGTYDPALNGGKAIDANDKIRLNYEVL